MTAPTGTGGRVVVVGGSGAVGRELVELLAGGDTEVVVVGRDGERAAAVARAAAERTGGSVIARQADVATPVGRRAALTDAAVVVMCVETANADIAREALTRGAHVVDVSATADVLASIEALDGLARASGSTAILGVGLAPGLTNLLARACVDRLPEAEAVDVTVLVGLGERHGVDAIRWTLDGLAAPAPASAGGRARVALPGFGMRRAHPFPFADQHTLTRTLGVPVTTRLCFDSRVVTAAAFALRRAAVLAHLPRPALAQALARVHVGSDRFAVTVTATTTATTTTTTSGGRRVTAAAAGRRQSYATAVVSAHVVQHQADGNAEPGVHHIDQVLDADVALAAVEAAGVTLRRP